MCAITKSKLFPIRKNFQGAGHLEKTSTSAGKRFLGVRRIALTVCVLLLSLDFHPFPAFGPPEVFGANFQVTPITQMTTDADGLPLRFPLMLFVDRNFGETYLTTSGKQKVTIYARDSYPVISFSAGRGIYKPQGIFVDHNGMIYVCQQPDKDQPARISVFNGAFLLVREIALDTIPGLEDFVPYRLVVNHDGLIYVTSRNHRGVLVLDNDGVFLRWLEPEDTIIYTWDIEQDQVGEVPPIENGDDAGVPPDQAAGNGTGAEIPEEFRPKSKSEQGGEAEPEIGPVMILDVSIDSTGKLYMLSNETSKTYVYSPDEKFLFSFGEKGGGPRQLSNPRSVAIDEDLHFIYVVDYMRHTILVFNQDDGKYLFEFGGRGTSPGWFNFPTDVAVNQAGQVTVADFFNHRLQVLEVKYQRELSLSEVLAPPAVPKAPDSTEEATQVADRSTLVAEGNEPLPEQPEDSSGQETEVETSGGQASLQGEAEPLPAQETGQPPQISPKSEVDNSDAAGTDQNIPVPAAEERELEMASAGANGEISPPGEISGQTGDFAAVEPFVASWLKAWEEKDLEAYLSHYSRDFITPGGISITEWEIQRQKSLGRPKFIKIETSDMQVQKTDDTHAQVTFIQEYQSNTYSDKVVKTIDLLWENLSWKILQETSKNL